jgi:hypothetical protein
MLRKGSDVITAAVALRAGQTRPFAAIPAFLVLGGVGALVVGWRWERTAVQTFGVGYLVRLACGTVLAYTFQYDDEVAIHGWASHNARLWSHGHFVTQSGGYLMIVTTLYWAFGANLMVSKAFNAMVGSVLPFLVRDITKRLGGGDRAQRRAFWLSMYLPTLILFSSTNLKEISTSFLIVLILWLVLVRPGPTITGAAMGLVVVRMMNFLRGAPWAIVAVAPVLLVTLLPGRLSWPALRRPRPWSLAFAAVIGVWVLFPLAKDINTQYVTDRGNSTYFQDRAQLRGSAVSKFVNPKLSPRSPRTLTVLTLRGVYSPSVVRGLFDPSLEALLEVFGSIAWYLLVPFALEEVIRHWRRMEVLTVGASFGVLYVFASSAVSLGADPSRHRVIGFPLLAALGMLTLGDSSDRRRWVHVAWWAGASVFTAAYIVVKAGR